MKGSDKMCRSFYYWQIEDLTGFRKLILEIDYNIEKEIDKFYDWQGEYKQCRKCNNNFPACTYFFISGGKEGLHNSCKTCENGSDFGWGRVYNNELNKLNKHYCSKCDRVFPLNSIYFSRTTGKCNKTGYVSNCKECTNGEFGIDKKINDGVIIPDIKTNFKICNTCLYELPNNDNYFCNKSGRKYGDVCCNNCKSPKRRIYNNIPLVKESKRQDSQKRRYKEKSLKNDLTISQYNETLLYFNNSCAYCGMSESKNKYINNCKLHQEHIIPMANGGEYTKTNIIPSCRYCNFSKGVKSLDEFFQYSDAFSEENYIRILSFIEINTIKSEVS